MKEKELVIDLETANVPTNEPRRRDLVAILSVGAIAFDAAVTQPFDQLVCSQYNASEQLIKENVLYTPVSFTQSLQHGFQVDPNTLQFWNDEVKQRSGYNMIEAATAFMEDIKFTFAKIEQFLKLHHDAKRIWMRDQSFDGSILREAMNHLGFTLPLNHFRFRDHRVIDDKGLFAIPWPAESETPLRLKHHALHDAAVEVMMRQALWARMNPEPVPAPVEEKPAAARTKKAAVPIKVTSRKAR